MAETLIYRTTALTKLGMTAKTFDRLNLAVAKEVDNPYRPGTSSRLYRLADVDKILSQRGNKPYTPKIRRNKVTEVFMHRSGGNSETLLPDVLDALEMLYYDPNHTKSEEVAVKQFMKQYMAMLEYVYQQGHCREVYRFEGEGKPCYTCRGQGKVYFFGEWDPCHICEGTGHDITQAVRYALVVEVDGKHWTFFANTSKLSFVDEKMVEQTSSSFIDRKTRLIGESERVQAKRTVKWFLSEIMEKPSKYDWL